MKAVIVPDPDNERGMRAVDERTGKILALGRLEVEVFDYGPGEHITEVSFIYRSLEAPK